MADPGCLSRILIFTHLGSRISDSGSQNSNKREGWKNFFVIPFYLATNFTKLNIILVLKSWRKKIGAIFKELYNFLPKKLSPSSQTYGFGIRDPGSGIRDPRSGIRKNIFRIPDPGGQKGTGSRIQIRNTVSAAGDFSWIMEVLHLSIRRKKKAFLITNPWSGSVPVSFWYGTDLNQGSVHNIKDPKSNPDPIPFFRFQKCSFKIYFLAFHQGCGSASLRILLLIKVMRICEHWYLEPPGLHGSIWSL